MNRERTLWVLGLTAAGWLLVVPAAGAYIDGASGSALFQFLIAGIAAAGMTLRIFWRRIVAFFRRGSATDDASQDAAMPVGSDER